MALCSKSDYDSDASSSSLHGAFDAIQEHEIRRRSSVPPLVPVGPFQSPRVSVVCPRSTDSTPFLSSFVKSTSLFVSKHLRTAVGKPIVGLDPGLTERGAYHSHVGTSFDARVIPCPIATSKDDLDLASDSSGLMRASKPGRTKVAKRYSESLILQQEQRRRATISSFHSGCVLPIGGPTGSDLRANNRGWLPRQAPDPPSGSASRFQISMFPGRRAESGHDSSPRRSCSSPSLERSTHGPEGFDAGRPAEGLASQYISAGLPINSSLNTSNKRICRDDLANLRLTKESIKDVFGNRCCNSFCVQRLGKVGIKFARERWFRQNAREQSFTLQHMVIFEPMKREWIYNINGGPVCLAAFKMVLCISYGRIARSKKSGSSNPAPRKPVGRKESSAVFALRNWLSHFFTLYCESQLDKNRGHLPTYFTKLEVYKVYREDTVVDIDQASVSLSQFQLLWIKYFDNVKIPKTNRFGACPQCEHFRNLKEKGEQTDDRERGRLLLEKHLEHQKVEREKLAKHRKKCFNNPKKYIGVVIDGMDQSKTSLPHWFCVPKTADPNCFVHIHLVGALVFNCVRKARVFLTYPNVRNDGNLTITIIHTLIQEFEGILPPTFYLQLDNTARENKNNLLMSYLHFLVARKIFRKIKVNFLLVGHTHDQIDQMFSTFSKRRSKTKAFTLDPFIHIIKSSYTPTPIVSFITSSFDFRQFSLGEPKIVLNSMHNLSFSHQFLIKFKDQVDTIPKQWAKRLSSDSEWKPEGGITFLVDLLPTKDLFFAPRLPLRKKGEKNPMPTVASTSTNPFTAEQMESFLFEIEKNILSLSHFFTSSDTTWWRSFFAEQRVFNNQLLAPPSIVPDFFRVCRHTVAMVPGSELPLATVPNAEEVDDILFGPSREIYVGAYKNPRRLEEEKEMQDGDFKDLKEGTMIVILATDCPYDRPFWLARVDKIKTSLDDGTPEKITITWFTCSSQEDDPLVAKYREEIAHKSYRRQKGKIRKALRKQDLIISKTTVLSYNFSLSTSKTLYKITAQIIASRL